MLQEDKNTLKMLVKEYSLVEVVRALAQVALAEADDLSDMSLKDKASVMADNADLLLEVTSDMTE